MLHSLGGARKVGKNASGPMSHSAKSDKKLQDRAQRRARLEAELRASLLKRKAQARGRAQQRDVAGGAGEEGRPETGQAQAGRPGEVA
jgi:hypothetical protein